MNDLDDFMTILLMDFVDNTSFKVLKDSSTAKKYNFTTPFYRLRKRGGISIYSLILDMRPAFDKPIELKIQVERKGTTYHMELGYNFKPKKPDSDFYQCLHKTTIPKTKTGYDFTGTYEYLIDAFK